jgi:hypothetical protein
LPDRPERQLPDFTALANAFDACVIDPPRGVNLRAKDGWQVYPSVPEGVEDGGFTTFGPIARGKELRGDGLAALLAVHFSEAYGLLLDSNRATLCKY